MVLGFGEGQVVVRLLDWMPTLAKVIDHGHALFSCCWASIDRDGRVRSSPAAEVLLAGRAAKTKKERDQALRPPGSDPSGPPWDPPLRCADIQISALGHPWSSPPPSSMVVREVVGTVLPGESIPLELVERALDLAAAGLRAVVLEYRDSVEWPVSRVEWPTADEIAAAGRGPCSRSGGVK